MAERERIERKLSEVRMKEEKREAGSRMIQRFLPFESLTREMFVHKVVILRNGSVRIEWNFEDFCRL